MSRSIPTTVSVAGSRETRQGETTIIEGGDSSFASSHLCDLVAELNNEGAFQMESGLYSDAIQAFTSALRIALSSSSRTSSLTQSQFSALNAAMMVSQTSVTEDHHHHHHQQQENSFTVPGMQRSAEQQSSNRKARRRRRHRRDSISSISSKDSSVAMAAASESNSRSKSQMRRRRRRQVPPEEMKHCTPRHTEDIALPVQKVAYTKALRVADRYNLPPVSELLLYLLYNLALAHHLQAIARISASALNPTSSAPTKQGSGTWQRITQLYKATIDWQEAAASDNSDDNEEDPPMLDPDHTLGLFNNLACSYFASGNDKDANETWQLVFSQLWCMIDVGFNSDEVESIHDVLLNVPHLLDPNHGTIATAA